MSSRKYFDAIALSTAIAAALFAPAVFAEEATGQCSADANAANVLADRVLQDQTARDYLRIEAGKGRETLTTVRHFAANLNGDDAQDDVVILTLNDASVVAGFVAQTGASAGTQAYAGYVPVDADNFSVARASDVTGDGRDEIRVEAVRKTSQGAGRRVLHLLTLDSTKLKRIFLAVLDSSEKHDIYQQRTTHLVRFKDTDGDGVNEIEVTARTVELLGEGKDKEREIAESVATTTTVYKLGQDNYAQVSSTTSAPSDEQQLVVASKLAQAGAAERAALHAHALLERASAQGHDTKAAIASRARALLETISGKLDGGNAKNAVIAGNAAPAQAG